MLVACGGLRLHWLQRLLRSGDALIRGRYRGVRLRVCDEGIRASVNPSAEYRLKRRLRRLPTAEA